MLNPGEAIYQKSEVEALVRQLQQANQTINTAKAAVADVMKVIPFENGQVNIPKIMSMVMGGNFPPTLIQSLKQLAALVELPEPETTQPHESRNV